MHKILTIILLSISLSGFAANSVPKTYPDVYAAIMAAAPQFLAKVDLADVQNRVATRFDPKVGHLVRISPVEHVNPADCTIELPVSSFVLMQEDIKNYKAGTPLSSLLRQCDLWYAPISYGTTNLGLLVIAKTHDGFRVDAFGYIPLQNSIKKIQAQYPGKELQIVSIEGRLEKLFHVPKISPTNLSYYSSRKLTDASEVLPQLIGVYKGAR